MAATTISASQSGITIKECCFSGTFSAAPGTTSSLRNSLHQSLSKNSWTSWVIPKRRCKQMAMVVSLAASTSTETFTPLKDLPALSYINSDGRIQPPIEEGTAASVFAIIDNNNRVQYIGFSKDIRNSLRTLMGRRPELCHYYKVVNLPVLDQRKMLAIRQQWVSELGGVPRGNSDTTQRGLWEQPVESGSISERGKAGAAMSKAKTLLQMMMDKGLKEEMVYNPALLEEGKCDILPSQEQTDEEKAKAAQARELEKNKTVKVNLNSPKGEKVEFSIFYEIKFPTNGGWMYDILVTHENKETRHRVIMGRMYPEVAGIEEDEFLEITMGFLLLKNIPRHTEGMRASSVFPINYFAVGQVEQRFDDFGSWFSKPLPDDHWHARRLSQYGPAIDTHAIIGPEEIVVPRNYS